MEQFYDEMYDTNFPGLHSGDRKESLTMPLHSTETCQCSLENVYPRRAFKCNLCYLNRLFNNFYK